MEMNSENYVKEILTKLFGEDLIDKLMSPEVPDEFVESVNNSLQEIKNIRGTACQACMNRIN